jgi:hypothetical protein
MGPNHRIIKFDAYDPAPARDVWSRHTQVEPHEAENLFLRYQLNIALRRAEPRLRLRGGDSLNFFPDRYLRAGTPAELSKFVR